jgi:hypothetical protein
MNISAAVEKKAWQIFRAGKVKKELETLKRIHFKIEGETEEHMVVFDKQKQKFSCDCRYFSLTQKECSHILASKLMLEK